MATVAKTKTGGKFTHTEAGVKHEITWGPTAKAGLTIIDIDGSRLGNFRTRDDGYRYGLKGPNQKVYPLTMNPESVVKAIVKEEMGKRSALAKAKEEAKAAKAKAKEEAKAAKTKAK